MRPHALFLCTFLATVPAIAMAQSPLAEAAKKAEEQRQQSGDQSQAFTDRDLRSRGSGWDSDLYGTKLTMEGLERYTNARVEMVRAMLADRELDRRVSQQTITDFREYELLLAAEPAFSERLAQAGITAHDYVYTEGALTIVEKMAANGTQPSKDLPPVVSVNLRFYRVAKPTINGLLAEAKDLEKQLVARRGGKKPARKKE